MSGEDPEGYQRPKPGPVHGKCDDEFSEAMGLDPIPEHLGNPGLVKWGSENVGDNVNLKVPFVSKTVEYVRGFAPSVDEVGEPAGGTDRWIEKERWTLSGEIIECESLKKIFEAQEKLREIFSEDWQTLTVGGGEDGLEVLHYGQLISISFGESEYVQDVPYEVVVEGYRSANDLPEERRVVDPVASYTWTEAEDATMELRYEVSARGIVTSDAENNALENAKKFVFDYLSDDNRMFKAEGEDFQPYIIYKEKNVDGKRYLVSDEEKIDRVAGSYGVVRVYRMDQTQGQYSSVLRYTTDSNINFGNIKETTFSGSIEIGYRGDVDADAAINTDTNMNELRERYNQFKDSNLIDPDNGDVLYKKNITREKIDEDKLGGVLTFNIVFGDPETCIDDYDVSIEEGAESSLIKVTVSGQCRYRGPCDFDTLRECFYGAYDLDCINKIESVQAKYYEIAKEYYYAFLQDNPEVDNGDMVVNAYPLSISVTEDPPNKVISYSVSFDDRLSYGAQSFDYTISVTPPVQQVVVNSFQEICTDNSEGDAQQCGSATPPKSHHYQDLGIGKAGTVGVKLTIVGSSDKGSDYIKQQALKSIGSTSDLLMTKNQMGGNQTDEGCSEREAYETHDCAWLWQKSGGGNVVNSNSSDRTKVVKLHFGNN